MFDLSDRAGFDVGSIDPEARQNWENEWREIIDEAMRELESDTIDACYKVL
ncbi:MAG: hypothetical protein IMZ50_08015 [Candidatus Atribacteria bacterium]|nr:hypothetical protein [Candidatus Atribacteria bacterium]